MKIERVAISKINPAAYNPRKDLKPTDKEYQKLKKSITQFDLVEPLIWNQRSGNLVGGHQRLKILQERGDQEVEVSVVDLDDAMEKVLNVALNKISGEWDYPKLKDLMVEIDTGALDIELTGWDEAELKSIIDYDPYPATDKDDEVPEVDDVEPVTKTGDLYQLGRHRLLCGDSTKREDVERLMDGKKADCVFTSPPYGVGIDYGDTYKDTIDNIRHIIPIMSHIYYGLIKDGGFAVINFGDIASAKAINTTAEPCEYPMAVEYFAPFRAEGWLLWSRRIWCKPNPRVHSLHCIGSNRAATDFEHIWTWKKPGDAIVKRIDNLSCYGWIDTTRETGVEIGKAVHGAGMAVSIAEKMVEIHSIKENVVFEPFAGTGTTIIACEKKKRCCNAIEISPHYCDVIVRRWEDYTGKKAVRLQDG